MVVIVGGFIYDLGFNSIGGLIINDIEGCVVF